MGRTMQFEFDWDPAKAESNLRKHGVAFERAMSIFLDNLRRYVAGEPLRNVVDKELGY